MVIDVFSAAACCIASIATLKNKQPETIIVTDDDFQTHTEAISYITDNEVTRCYCGGWCAFAKHSYDFSIRLDGLDTNVFGKNSEFFKIVFKTAAKMMTELSGAEIQLIKEETENERIFTAY